MGKLLGFIGATIGGSIGWWMGSGIGIMTAFLLSIVASGAGLYAGRRMAERYGP